MPVRRLLPVALLALTVTACTSAPTQSRPTPTPTGRTWTPAEQSATAEATAQYKESRAAYDAALNNPIKATRATLESAGMSGVWLDDAVAKANDFRARNTRRVGAVKILSTEPIWVDLTAPTPAVVLKTCLDYSSVADHDPGTVRRLVDARLLRLPTGWSLTAESESPDTAQAPTPGKPLC
ncbi:hypothetical protein OG474_32170 [Kribbella sp. NBC_01505]|uniref:hypothetical protein n=1 Tax=Kribbella sp. NBC_01505 TaxID=2903580 RepID=UPI003868E843